MGHSTRHRTLPCVPEFTENTYGTEFFLFITTTKFFIHEKLRRLLYTNDGRI